MECREVKNKEISMICTWEVKLHIFISGRTQVKNKTYQFLWQI